MGILANQIWGQELETFESIPRTILRIYELLEGTIEFNELRTYDSVWTPIFVVCFFALAKFLLLNVFATIVVDAYYVVKITSTGAVGEKWDFKRWMHWAIPALCRDIFRAL